MAAKCQLLIDSTCDISADRARALGLDVLPFSYTSAELSGIDDLFQTRSAHEFYDAVRRGACPMTSQPSQATYDHAFLTAFEQQIPTVYLSISSGISGAYEGACMSLARLQELHPDKEIRIYIVDSKLASTSLNLLVEEALNRINQGLNAEQLVAWLENARYFVHTHFMVDNLDALHRGGRIPKTVALLGDALDVKPLLTFSLEGTLSIEGVVRGRKKGMKKLLELFAKEHVDGQYGTAVAVGDADAPDDGYQLASTLHELDDTRQVLRPQIGPTIGSHVGPGMISCCFWGQDRRTQKPLGRVKGVRSAK